MPTSTFPGTVTGVTVETATNGALSGDGSSGNKLAVGVDGTTIEVNGSNQLEALGAAVAFKTIAVAGQSNIVADAADDTLTIVAGTNITLTTNASTDTLTINAASGGSSSPAAWDSGTTYATGNVVTEWSGLWRAVDASTNSKPDSGNAHWTLISDSFTKVIDLTADQIAHLNSSPVVAFTGVSGKVVQVVGGFGAMYRGSIPFSAYGAQLFYAPDAVSQQWALLDDALLDFDGSFGDDMLAATIATPRSQIALDIASGQDVQLKGNSDDLTGCIATAVINDGGLGYAPGDTVSVDVGTPGVLTVNTVGALGVVTSLTVTTAGYGYTAGTGDATTAILPATGTGLTVNTTITPANGTARVWITAKILSLP